METGGGIGRFSRKKPQSSSSSTTTPKHDGNAVPLHVDNDAEKTSTEATATWMQFSNVDESDFNDNDVQFEAAGDFTDFEYTEDNFNNSDLDAAANNEMESTAIAMDVVSPQASHNLQSNSTPINSNPRKFPFRPVQGFKPGIRTEAQTNGSRNVQEFDPMTVSLVSMEASASINKPSHSSCCDPPNLNKNVACKEKSSDPIAFEDTPQANKTKQPSPTPKSTIISQDKIVNSLVSHAGEKSTRIIPVGPLPTSTLTSVSASASAPAPAPLVSFASVYAPQVPANKSTGSSSNRVLPGLNKADTAEKPYFPSKFDPKNTPCRKDQKQQSSGTEDTTDKSRYATPHPNNASTLGNGRIKAVTPGPDSTSKLISSSISPSTNPELHAPSSVTPLHDTLISSVSENTRTYEADNNASFEELYAKFQSEIRDLTDLQDRNKSELLEMDVLFATAYFRSMQNQANFLDLLEELQKVVDCADEVIRTYGNT